MKKVILGIILAFMVIGCSSDDDSTQTSSGITIDGVSYNFNTGYAVDRGGFVDGESSFAFVLGTSPFTLNEDGLPSVVALGNTDGVNGILSLELESLTPSFETGTYTLSPTGNSADKSVIFCTLRSAGEDGVINLFDNFISGTSGTVEITGTSDNFILDFDIQLANGENLNFVYDSGTSYVDGRWD